ncbi:uncharacterized protein METZ01_LOCUS10147 [marine metagenome]|uniref:Uncharacterized protein n=1 Tax=marine metagenome TaxID=408172 RepID=A0A381NUX7_9ZZZZ
MQCVLNEVHTIFTPIQLIADVKRRRTENASIQCILSHIDQLTFDFVVFATRDK